MYLIKMSWPIFFCCVLLCIANSLSIPKSHSNRGTVKPLSDEVHYGSDNNEHNPEYDHEAFLGEEEAKHFDEMSPEESQVQLSLLFDKVDIDGDRYLTESELQNWIRKVQFRYAEEDAGKKWLEIKPERGDKMKWEEHELHNFGNKESIETNPDESVQDMVKREQARWKAADYDGDGLLNKEEYSAFLHPESSKSMEDVVAEETLYEMDKNEDGFIDLEEFIEDMIGDGEDEEEDVQWVESEKQNFAENLDVDQDGKLNKEELKKWLMSDELDQIVDETEHLFSEADINEDKLLSKQEVLDKYDVFVGSQATDYGDILGRHDEF